MVLLTLSNVLLALVPRAVIAVMQTTMMSANMTAYSTAVGPSSRFRPRVEGPALEGGAMATWRTLASLVVALAATTAARAQTYPLQEEPLVGTFIHVKLTMTLAGEMKVQQEGKDHPLKESATAAH